MSRDELDAWFAQADDVLDNWHGSVDAMHSGEVPTLHLPSGGYALYGDMESERYRSSELSWRLSMTFRLIVNLPLNPNALIITSVS